MITKLTKAVLKKHGPFTLVIDDNRRIGIKRIGEDASAYRYWSFGLTNCLIRLLAENQQINNLKGK